LATVQASERKLRIENKEQQQHITRLLKQSSTLITNITLLYDTAKLEIQRKDDEIAALRKQLLSTQQQQKR
jgi:hypothetical protein